ncbi:OadG-related small transporter subunit [Thermoclostridium stercorarium]
MEYGLLGTFAVIILFYIVILILRKILPYRNEDNKD